ncbi:MAG: N-acetyltransferase [Bacteroidales bacterium]|nr:N-acetyltransferase [Bacteroidales bacterium]
MDLRFRQTYTNEFYQTEFLTRETFWNLYNPGCTEHFILHNLRQSDAYIKQLDLVVLQEDNIVGHIISTRAKVVDNEGTSHEALCVGPFAIDSKFQSKGIGTQLMNYLIKESKKLGFKGIVLFGNPHYYSRFGFKNAKEYHIATKDGMNFDAFMVLELQEKGLTHAQGKFFEDKAFEVDEDQLIIFDKQFPSKVKGEPKININI